MTTTEIRIQSQVRGLRAAVERLEAWTDFEHQAKRRGFVDPAEILREAVYVAQVADGIQKLITLRTEEGKLGAL